MKKAIAITLLFISSISYGQSKPDSTVIQDSIKILSVNDIQTYLNQLSDKITVKDQNTFVSIIQYMIAEEKKKIVATKNGKK